MAPKKECPHDTTCQSPDTCRAKRYRDKRKRDEAQEDVMKEMQKAARTASKQALRRKDREFEEAFLAREGDEFRYLLPSEHEETLMSLQDELNDSQTKFEEGLQEIRALTEKLRRRDQRIAELQAELRDARCPGKVGNTWSPKVVLLAMTLRSAGVGLGTTGRLLSFIFKLLFGTDVPLVPSSTLGTWDKLAGPLSVHLILKELTRRRPASLAWMQDTSSGARHGAGWSVSAVGLSMKHPCTDGRVLCSIMDTEVGNRGLAEVKADQIRGCESRLVSSGLPRPTAIVGDHSNDQASVAGQLSVTFCGCMSHKLAKACEYAMSAVCASYDDVKKKPGADILRGNMSALLTALDAARTKATTQSGLLCKAYLFADESSSVGLLAGIREVGHKYGFHLHLADRLLHSRSQLKKAKNAEDLTITGSTALYNLLECRATATYLSVMAIGSWFFHHCIALFRQDGDVNYSKAKECCEVITVLISEMKCCKDIAAVQKCFPSRDFTTLIDVCDKRSFTKTWRKFVDVLESKWIYMLSLHADPKTSTAALNATPATNDFVEGFFGFVATLGAKLGPTVHPLRLTSLATFAYNRRTLLELCPELQLDAGVLTELRSGLKWESQKEICFRVHKNVTCARREGELMKRSAEETTEVFKKVFGVKTEVPARKVLRVRQIVDKQYTRPEA